MITSPQNTTPSGLRKKGMLFGCCALLALVHPEVRECVAHIIPHDVSKKNMNSGELLYEYYLTVQNHLDMAMARVDKVLQKEGNSLSGLTEMEVRDRIINVFLADEELQKNHVFINAIKEGSIIMNREIFFDDKGIKKNSFSFSVGFRNTAPHVVTIILPQLIEIVPEL